MRWLPPSNKLKVKLETWNSKLGVKLKTQSENQNSKWNSKLKTQTETQNSNLEIPFASAPANTNNNWLLVVKWQTNNIQDGHYINTNTVIIIYINYAWNIELSTNQ